MQPNLLDRELYGGDPYPTFAWMRAHQPVYHDPSSGLWGLFLHADVQWAEKHRELFSSAPGSRPCSEPQPSMIDSDDPLHQRRRRLVDDGFAAKRVQTYETWIREIVTELIDGVEARGGCDLVADLAAPLPTAVIADLLGVPPEDRATLQHWSDVMVSGADGPWNHTPEVLDAAAAYYTYMNAVFEDRRSHPTDDAISALVHAEVDGSRLAVEELWGESLLLLVGGNETTRNVISGGLEALLRRPDQMARLREDPSLIPTAVEECIRWVTPVVNMARTTTSDVEVRGCTIPAGEQVLLVYSSANRDERAFPDPDVFDVRREPNLHVSFGFGSHYCLGAPLARLEIRITLEEVLRRLPHLRLADPDAPVEHTRSSFIRGIVRLPVTTAPARR